MMMIQTEENSIASGTLNDLSQMRTFQQRWCGVMWRHKNQMVQLTATIAPIGDQRIRMLWPTTMLIYQELQCGAVYNQEDKFDRSLLTLLFLVPFT